MNYNKKALHSTKLRKLCHSCNSFCNNARSDVSICVEITIHRKIPNISSTLLEVLIIFAELPFKERIPRKLILGRGFWLAGD